MCGAPDGFDFESFYYSARPVKIEGVCGITIMDGSLHVHKNDMINCLGRTRAFEGSRRLRNLL
jgi:hypothetical protein